MAASENTLSDLFNSWKGYGKELEAMIIDEEEEAEMDVTSDINNEVLKSVNQSGEKSLSEILKTWKEHGEELQKECDYDTFNHEYYCEQCKKVFFS